MIVALAGRRVDAPEAPEPRFPVEQIDAVRERIRAALNQQHADTLVASAACGADLLALDVAGELGIRRRVILPFPRDEFRASSVTDRPGDWGAMFDRVCDDVEAHGDLVILGATGDPDAAYAEASHRILDEALQLANDGAGRSRIGGGVVAIVVWDQVSRGPDDLTVTFANQAVEHKVPVVSIPTL
jgi:hypothetical protein